MRHAYSLIPFARRKHHQGAILITTLLLVALISALTAATLYRVSSRYSSSYQSAGWNEALASAEGGADLAMLALNNSLTSPSTAWAAWTPNDASTFPKTYVPSLANHSGQGNNKVYAKITVDKGLGNGWIRVRSTGVAELPAQARNGLEAAILDTNGLKNHRSMLRKTSYVTDQTGGALHRPQVARTIEVLAAPSASYPYIRALTVKNTITMSGGSYIDSFDSSNPAYSTNGQYDATKRLSHGDIATNVSGTLSNLGSMYVYGNASSNGGTMQNTSKVQGTITNNFQTTIPDITTPVLPNVQATPTIIKNSGASSLVAGTAAAPKSYILSELTTSGSDVLTLTNPNPGTDAYINIYVTGNSGIAISGSSYIKQQPGVHATIYVAGKIAISGGGVLNQTNTASYLQVFGITPSSGTLTADISGSSAFVGVFNGPAYTLTSSGSSAFIGAAIANSFTVSGSGGFHYDQALSNLSGPGAPATYTYSSWAEDIR